MFLLFQREIAFLTESWYGEIRVSCEAKGSRLEVGGSLYIEAKNIY